MIYTWNLDPVALSLFGLEIYWYGIAYLVSFFVFDFLGWRIYKHFYANPKLNKKQFSNLIFGGFLAGILGGRIGFFLFYQPSVFWTDPLAIINFWEGGWRGMSIHGGILAVILFGFFQSWKNQIAWRPIADILSLPLAISLFLGRLANFANGELWGRPTGQNWGVIFPHVDELLRHPSQLYEASKNIIMIIVIIIALRKGWLQYPGRIFGLTIFIYGLLRFLIEFVREPNFYVGPLTMGQVLCSLMMILGGILVFASCRNTSK